MEDTEIVALYHRRDQDAIAERERKCGTRLFGLANRIPDDREDSSECMNGALLSAWRTRSWAGTSGRARAAACWTCG